MAGVTGLEPAASCVTGRRSNRLSYTPGKGRRSLPEVCCRSSELGEKTIRATDAKEVGVGNTAEETCRCPNQLGMVCLRPNYVNPKYNLSSIRVAKRHFRAKFGKKLRNKNGGEGGIRTPVTFSSNHAFQACAFNRSATSPASGGALCEMLRQPAS